MKLLTLIRVMLSLLGVLRLFFQSVKMRLRSLEFVILSRSLPKKEYAAAGTLGVCKGEGYCRDEPI